MKIWGIGANLRGNVDISDDFINRNIAYLGYKKRKLQCFMKC